MIKKRILLTLKLKEIVDVLDANVLSAKSNLDLDIDCACGSDMMSEVLAFSKYNAVLLTGLINNHVLRTAEMLDIEAIIYVRGKVPSDEIIEMSEEMGITLITTEMTMFSACGILYTHGIKGGRRVHDND